MRTTFVVAALLAMVTMSIAADSAAPSAAPTTQAVTGSLHGHVTMGREFSLQKPDLARVVIFLGDDPVLHAASAPPHRAFVAQHNKAFEPNFLVVQRNTLIEFPNWDHYDHNVFSRSAAAPAFDLERYPYGQSKSRVFTKLGVVQLFCNIHPQMRAVIYITPNSFCTRCQSNGEFTLANVPAGKFTILAWQERCGQQEQSVEIKPGQTTEISFTLDQKHDRVISSADPDRRASYGVERGLGVKRDVLDLPVVHGTHPAPPESQPK